MQYIVGNLCSVQFIFFSRVVPFPINVSTYITRQAFSERFVAQLATATVLLLDVNVLN